MQLKVLILDDEPIQRRGIAAKLESLGLPLTVAGTAADGEEGLELLRELKPDIVMTDIRMPEMDGLAFIERARQADGKLAMIVLSGYSEFEYAKRAMQYGVTDYLLKPLDDDELRAVLVRTMAQIMDARASRSEVERMKQHLESGREYTRQQLLTRMIQEPDRDATQPDEAQRILEEFGDGCQRYRAIVLVVEPYRLPLGSFRVGDEKLIGYALSNMMSDRMKSAGRQGFLFQHAIHRNELVYLVGEDGGEHDAPLERWLRDVLSGVVRYLKLDVTIAIGPAVEGIAHIQESYRLAKSALRNKIVRGPNQIFDCSAIYHESHAIRLPIQDQDARLLLKLLAEGDGHALTGWAEERLLQLIRLPNVSYVQLDRFCVDFYLLLRNYLMDRIDGADWLIGEIGDLHYALQRLKDIQDAIGLLREQIATVIGYLKQNDGVPARDVLEEIKRYMTANLQEPISLQSIAERYFINPTYFSRRFKEKFGQSYSDFLSELRMSKAAEWLKVTELKVQDIAEMVGYDGANYFSYAFRKWSGLSPVEYRQKNKAAKVE